MNKNLTPVKYLPIVSQHSTDNLSIFSIPDVVTDGSPDVVVQYFYTSFSVMTPVCQSHLQNYCKRKQVSLHEMIAVTCARTRTHAE